MLKADRGVRASQVTLAVDAASHANRKLVQSGNDHQSLHFAEDIGLAQQWLADGAPVADVITMLEARHRFELSPDRCRALAVEILWAALGRSQPNADLNPNSKESRYAAA